MDKTKNTNTKVIVDPAILEKTPTVAVSAPPLGKKGQSSNQPVKSLSVNLLNKTVTFVSDFLETIVVALSIFVVVYLFLVQPHEVKGSSMEPNFHNNEYILTDKISYRFRKPARGEVVIFKSPKNPEVDYIKRIIALPGERVKIKDGYVYINEEKLNEYYLDSSTNLFPGSSMQEGVEIVIPEGEFLVLGDNRPHSSDSREFGPISQDLIIGHAFIRYWPLSQLGFIPKITYSLKTASDK